MSSASGPRYIVNLDTLRGMANDLNRIHGIFIAYQTMKMQQLQKQHLQQSQTMNNMMSPSIINKPDLPQSQIRPIMLQNRPSGVTSPAQPQLSSQQQAPPNFDQTAPVQPTSRRNSPQTLAGPAAISSPSPSHVTSTLAPVASAPAPTATASSLPAATKLVTPQHPASLNASVYTLNTPKYREDASSDRTHLVSLENPSYGSTFPRPPCIRPSKGMIFGATFKMAVVFIVTTILLGSTLWFALPTLDAYVGLFSCFICWSLTHHVENNQIPEMWHKMLILAVIFHMKN